MKNVMYLVVKVEVEFDPAHHSLANTPDIQELVNENVQCSFWLPNSPISIEVLKVVGGQDQCPI